MQIKYCGEFGLHGHGGHGHANETGERPGELPPCRRLLQLTAGSNAQLCKNHCTMVSSEPLTLKSPNDAKLYRLVVLDNGLRALLVHDPEIGQQQHVQQAVEPGAALGRDALEGSDEDVDSLLSGDEDESGSEVGAARRRWRGDGCSRQGAGTVGGWGAAACTGRLPTRLQPCFVLAACREICPLSPPSGRG